MSWMQSQVLQSNWQVIFDTYYYIDLNTHLLSFIIVTRLFIILIFRLSGNPPFYDETEEENTDMHNRIIFCRIVAGDYEFDTPYWDDISPAGAQ